MKKEKSEIKERLRTFCDMRGLKIQFVIDKAVEKYLDNYEQSEKGI